MGIPAAKAQENLAPNVTSYPSLQAAIDANPGQMLFVPSGDYRLTRAVEIRQAGSGFYGFGRLIRENTNAPIIEVRGAADVLLRDLTLTRAAGATHTRESAVRADDCPGLRLEGLRIRDKMGRHWKLEVEYTDPKHEE